MFTPMELDDADYRMKPMNCPFHILIYKNSPKSYRDLPVRYAELGNVYRYERSGTMHGLLRVRGFTQDDAHIFCEPSQIEDEIVGCIEFAQLVLTTFGLRSSRWSFPPGIPKTARIMPAPTRTGIWRSTPWRTPWGGRQFPIKPSVGRLPSMAKIDIKLVDVLGRLWQLSTGS